MSSISTQKQIFFHAGLQRTGTTFLQKNVFPAFQDITYVSKKQYPNAQQIIESSNQKVVLVSREFNKSFEEHVCAFKEQITYPIIPVLVLRRHDKWLLSQYKRYVKNGTKVPIDQFFPLDGKQGHLNTDALNYFDKIQFLVKTFSSTPLVLLHQELLENPKEVIQGLAEKMGAKVDWPSINLNPRHTSYSEHQLKVLYASYQKLVPGNFRKNKVYRYSVLHLAKMLPNKRFQEFELFPKTYLEALRKKYQSDWDASMQYVNDHRDRSL